MKKLLTAAMALALCATGSAFGTTVTQRTVVRHNADGTTTRVVHKVVRPGDQRYTHNPHYVAVNRHHHRHHVHHVATVHRTTTIVHRG